MMFGAQEHQEILRRLHVLQLSMNWVVRELARISNKESSIMVSIADIQAKADEELRRVNDETSVVNAVKQVVENQNAKLDALKKQVDDLIAGGSASEAELQTLSDTLDAIRAQDTANAEVVAQAVVAGTPVDSQPDEPAPQSQPAPDEPQA